MKKILFIPLFVVLATGYFSCICDPIDDDCIPDPQPDCICTEEYNPVCGCDDQVYSNACEAECNGIFSYTLGPCE